MCPPCRSPIELRHKVVAQFAGYQDPIEIDGDPVAVGLEPIPVGPLLKVRVGKRSLVPRIRITGRR
jgi:hypothetical protein